MAESKEKLLFADDNDTDSADDKAILAQLMGQHINIADYVYSFRRGGQAVEGLSLIGINEAANRKGSIKVEEALFEERPHSWLAFVKAIDTSTREIHYGVFEQPKRTPSGKMDVFAFTKAIHKAQRNAIRQHLSPELLREIINLYRKEMGREPVVDDNEETEPSDAEKNESPKHTITNAQKSAFAQANRLNNALLRAGITQNDLWNSIKQRFNVESRNDITEAEWTILAAELQAAEGSRPIFTHLVQRIQQAFADDEFPAKLKVEMDENVPKKRKQESKSAKRSRVLRRT